MNKKSFSNLHFLFKTFTYMSKITKMRNEIRITFYTRPNLKTPEKWSPPHSRLWHTVHSNLEKNQWIPHFTTVSFHYLTKLLNCYLLLELSSLSSMMHLPIVSEHYSDSSPQLLSSSRKCLKGFSIHRGSQEQLRVTGSHWPWPEQSSKHTAEICHKKWQWK